MSGKSVPQSSGRRAGSHIPLTDEDVKKIILELPEVLSTTWDPNYGVWDKAKVDNFESWDEVYFQTLKTHKEKRLLSIPPVVQRLLGINSDGEQRLEVESPTTYKNPALPTDGSVGQTPAAPPANTMPPAPGKKTSSLFDKKQQEAPTNKGKTRANNEASQSYPLTGYVPRERKSVSASSMEPMDDVLNDQDYHRQESKPLVIDPIEDPNEVAAFRQWKAASEAERTRLSQRIESVTLSDSTIIPNPVSTPAQQLIHQITVRDSPPEAGISRDKDYHKICKTLAIQKFEKFDGTSSYDAPLWFANLAKDLMLLNVDEAVWHYIGFQFLDGAALTELRQVIGSPNCPSTYSELEDFVINAFPSLLSLINIQGRFDNFKFRPNEKVCDAVARFRVLQNDAIYLGFEYQESTVFLNKLPPYLHRYVQGEIERDSRAGRPMTFSQVTLCAIDRDNQLRSEKDHVNTVSTPQNHSSNNKKNNKRKNPEGGKSDVVCYNCGKKGHRFGTLVNHICPEKASPRTLNYFKKNKGSGSSSNAVASGSGESKA
ncbi:Hypothetical protein MELLADRAFT_100910 [Melampsora larici-populina 98AG31]|uniref:Uncharacterized protein n=1 Tax=Melampsora larici-populina (strain 98AG31 / pathotype 3-4-7) TaxID=747676 RepID=F4R2Z8_MELLP|nr:Hypothetical protein MELLADRAFT_100910 [Melampsora larici-populina 98AG31]EGG13255.1 Hypothetical protein MELLADRAFT_100910 [Melampsora larici-populina 98AG31]